LEIANKLQIPHFPRYDPLANINARIALPGELLVEIIPLYDPKSIGCALNDLGLEEARAWICEIEINEYPQQMRMKITHRDTDITDY